MYQNDDFNILMRLIVALAEATIYQAGAGPNGQHVTAHAGKELKDVNNLVVSGFFLYSSKFPIN